MLNWFEILGTVVFTIALILGTAVGTIYLIIPTQCSARAEIMSVDHDWGFWSGCMIKAESGWRPLEGYRVNEDF